MLGGLRLIFQVIKCYSDLIIKGIRKHFSVKSILSHWTYLAAAWFVFFLEILWTPRSHVQTPQNKNLSEEETLYPADRRQFSPNVNKNVQGVSISQCPYLTFVIKTKKQKKRASLRKKLHLIKIFKRFKYLHLWWSDVTYLVSLLSGNYFYHYITSLLTKRNIKNPTALKIIPMLT